MFRYCLLLTASLVLQTMSPAQESTPSTLLTELANVQTVDPVGAWSWEQRGSTSTLELKLEDGKLSGTIKSSGGNRGGIGGRRFGGGANTPSAIKNVMLEGDKLSFDVERSRGEMVFVTKYAGVISGDEIAGVTASSFGGQTRESAWMAKRVSSASNATENPQPPAQQAAETSVVTPQTSQPTGQQIGQRRGGRQRPDPRNDSFYVLGPDSQPHDGVPKGTWVGPNYLPSEVFPGYQHTYHIYVPAQYDKSAPAAVMIFNDGQAMMHEPGDVQAHNVLDNLIYRREIPVMLGVFINPARTADQPEPTPSDWGDRTTLRADEYNPPNDKYARVIVDELMPALKKDFNISDDPNLHGIQGSSSGGCAAFGVAWFRPDDFRKVITFVGSFTDIRGEHVYPELVAEAEKKPIRIFMQDGRNDNRRSPDSLNNDWFYQNVRLKNALEEKGYEVNYVWGIGNHGQKQGGAMLPEMMRWLWRDQPVDPDPTNMVERSFREAVAK